MPRLTKDLFEDITAQPKEHYSFIFTEDEIAFVEKKYMGALLFKMGLFIFCCALLFTCGIILSGYVVAFALGMAFIGITSYIKIILAYKKSYAEARQRYPKTVFDYTLYDCFMIVWISSDTSVKQMKFGLEKVKSVMTAGKFLTLEIDGQIYLLRSDELIDDSYFLAISSKK